MTKYSFAPFVESRRNNFDFFRFALASIVILVHCGPPKLEGFKIAHHILFLGPHAVDGFFIISGFLITGSWLKSKNITDFARKRFFRIYPGMAAALLFCVLIVAPASGVNIVQYLHHWRNIIEFFRPLLLGGPIGLPGVFSNLPWRNTVDGPLWTVRFEILCYGIVALFGVCGVLRTRLRVAVAFILSLLLYGFVFYYFHDNLGVAIAFFGQIGELPRLITYFLAGMTFYCYADVIPRSKVLAAISAIMILLFYTQQPIIMTTFGTYLVFYFAFSSKLNAHAFARHGDFSYGMYVYAFPPMQLFIQHFGYLPVPEFFPFAFSMALILGMASWHFIEKPFLRIGSRRPAVIGEELKATFESGAQSPTPVS